MPSLSDGAVQRLFAQDVERLWTRFADMEAPLAIQLVTMAVNKALDTAQVPRIKSLGGAVGVGAHLDSDHWAIRFDTTGVAQAITHASAEQFIWLTSLTYHEARHAEQFFRIAQAISLREITVPPNLNPNLMGNPIKRLDIMRAMTRNGPRIGSRILEEADRRSGSYHPAMSALVRTWYHSFYGANRAARNVIPHITWATGAQGFTNPATIAYRHLPEEEDAYNQQSAVAQLIKSAVAAGTYDDALEGVAALFV